MPSCIIWKVIQISMVLWTQNVDFWLDWQIWLLCISTSVSVHSRLITCVYKVLGLFGCGDIFLSFPSHLCALRSYKSFWIKLDQAYLHVAAFAQSSNSLVNRLGCYDCPGILALCTVVNLQCKVKKVAVLQFSTW